MGYCRPSCLLLVSTEINPTNPGADLLRYSRSTTYNVHGTQGHGFPCKDFLRTTAKLFPKTKSTNPQSPRRRPDKTDKTVSFANPLTTSPNRLPLQNRSPNHNSIHDGKRKNLCLSSKLPGNRWLENLWTILCTSRHFISDWFSLESRQTKMDDPTKRVNVL
jgi:hypothetical protein